MTADPSTCAYCGHALNSFAEAQAHHPCAAEERISAAKAPCPAWEDGAHCYAVSATPIFSDAKFCACGASVRRAVPAPWNDENTVTTTLSVPLGTDPLAGDIDGAPVDEDELRDILGGPVVDVLKRR